MDALETLVRDTLADRAHDAPPDAGLLDAVTGRQRRHWPIAVAAAAVVVLAIALTTTLVVRRSANPSAGVPAGYERIASHGITLLVPTRVATQLSLCSQSRRYFLWIADYAQAGRLCGVGLSPVISSAVVSVRITPNPARFAPGHSYLRYGTQPGSLAATGDRRLAPPGVTIAVTAPTHAQVRTILTSARVGRDPYGCPTHRTPVSNTPSATLVPGSPTSVVRCVYSGHLVASIPLPHPARLARRLDTLPLEASSDPGAPPTMAVYERDLLGFGYADRPARTIEANLGPSTYTDGQRTVTDYNQRVAQFVVGK